MDWRLLTIIVVYAAIVYLFEKWLRKKLGVSTEGEGFWYRYVNAFHKWGELVILLTFIVLLAIFIDRQLWVYFIAFLVLQSFRSWMEWKYQRETKAYVVSMLGILLILGMMGILYLWYA